MPNPSPTRRRRFSGIWHASAVVKGRTTRQNNCTINRCLLHYNAVINGYQASADAVRSAVRNAPLRYRLFPRVPKGGGSLGGF